MTPEEKREFTIARINSFLFELKHMHGDDALAEAYAKLMERLTDKNEISSLSVEQEKAAYRRFIRNLILFLADLKGRNTDKKDVVDEMIADLL